MPPKALSALVTLATFALSANAQQATFPATPLAEKRFPWPTGVPYQADTDTNLIRGGQYGYNQCNETTAGQDSRCQTSFMNSIEDFCLWAPPEPNMVVGNHEGEMVAWCTKLRHGTRLIPEGALTGIQWIRAPSYVAVIGFVDQTKINIQFGDWGGEMDPHGADLRGNPLGGLMYSNAWGQGGEDYEQVIEWHNFIGGNQFCLKACSPLDPDDDKYCEHIFDRIGCAYNVPNAARNGTFESCDGENQDFPGTYTDESGATQTYTQPPESLGAISTMPYTARIPATSNCVQYESAELYKELVGVTADPANVVPTASAASGLGLTTSATGTAGASQATAKSGAAAAAASGSGTGTAQNAESTSNSADVVMISSVGVSLLGVLFSVVFLS